MENKTNSPQNSKMKILLIKRDETVAAAYTKKLSAEGHEVKIMNDPSENFLAEITDFMPQVIITGIMLNSKISGLDIIKRIRGDKKIGGMKIIILTAVEGDEAKEEAKVLGVSDYFISTLITPGQLAQKVAELAS